MPINAVLEPCIDTHRRCYRTDRMLPDDSRRALSDSSISKAAAPRLSSSSLGCLLTPRCSAMRLGDAPQCTKATTVDTATSTHRASNYERFLSASLIVIILYEVETECPSPQLHQSRKASIIKGLLSICSRPTFTHITRHARSRAKRGEGAPRAVSPKGRSIVVLGMAIYQ